MNRSERETLLDHGSMEATHFKSLSKLAPFAGGPWNLPHKYHLYLIYIFGIDKQIKKDDSSKVLTSYKEIPHTFVNQKVL